MTKLLFTEEDLAPCGINCGTCSVRLRKKNPCGGCRSAGFKPKHCSNCSIKNCEYLSVTGLQLCYKCKIFPCRRLKQFDYRYRKNYKFSLIFNLKEMQRLGINAFLDNEAVKWKCPVCGNAMSVHKDKCLVCEDKL